MLAAALKTGIFLTEYQRMRLQVFLDGGISEYNYIGMMLKELLAGSKLFGRSPGGLELIQGNKLPGFDSEYILIWIGSYYGILAAGLVCTVLFFSYGGSGIITCYILVGMLLSIYRYQDVLPAEIAVAKKRSSQMKAVTEYKE